MPVVKSTPREIDLLLERLMRAEVEGDGNLAMLMVGNVGINRVIGDCLNFKDIRSIEQMFFSKF